MAFERIPRSSERSVTDLLVEMGAAMHRSTRALYLLTAVLCLLGLTGCGSTTPILREASSGRWVRMQTEHFDLCTDLGEVEATNAAMALERTRDALLTAAWSKDAGRRATARANVVVLASGLEFERYMSRRVNGVFISVVEPTLFLWGTPDRWERRERLGDESTTSVLRHELVHRLAAGIYGRQPRWFSEGLAQFLESIVISEDGKSAVLGRPNMVAFLQYKTHRSISVSDALAWKSSADLDDGTVSGLYGMSWILVHWLYNTQPKAFDAYQERLAAGFDPDSAWSESFGALNLEEIDKQLFHYSRFGNFQELSVPLEPSAIAPPKPAPLTQADTHAILAHLAVVGSLRHEKESLQAEAREQIGRALALEPANVLALRLHLRLESSLPVLEWIGRLRAQVQRRPDDGKAWLFLGKMLRGDGSGPERLAALRRAVALLPGNPDAYNALAWELVSTGHGEEALPLAMKASLLAPWDAAIVDTYAASLFAVGRCPDALKAQTRAVDLIPESARGSKGTRPYTEKLDEYRRSCGEGAK